MNLVDSDLLLFVLFPICIFFVALIMDLGVQFCEFIYEIITDKIYGIENDKENK